MGSSKDVSATLVRKQEKWQQDKLQEVLDMAIQDIYQAVLGFDGDLVANLVKKEVDQRTDVSAILRQGLIAALDEVGERFGRGDMFLPEMLAAAQAMKGGLEVIRPLLTGVDAQSAGTMVIGTVQGDLHDIGKDLVSMMVEGAGFRVFNLGVDVHTEAFLRTIDEKDPDILALSALLTTTMPAMRETVSLMKKRNIRAKIIVGGAPVTQSFADQIGADGYADDAPGAVALVRKLLGRK
jgi:5-methyltetrahydrofolate--homocysteine methyltransferase